MSPQAKVKALATERERIQSELKQALHAANKGKQLATLTEVGVISMPFEFLSSEQAALALSELADLLGYSVAKVQ